MSKMWIVMDKKNIPVAIGSNHSEIHVGIQEKLEGYPH